jgi:hypothetical protein
MGLSQIRELLRGFFQNCDVTARIAVDFLVVFGGIVLATFAFL